MMAVTPSPRPHQRQHKQFESEENILHVCVDQSINELLFSLGNSMWTPQCRTRPGSSYLGHLTWTQTEIT